MPANREEMYVEPLAALLQDKGDDMSDIAISVDRVVKIRPCPFCGEDSASLEIGNKDCPGWLKHVHCCRCGTRGPEAKTEESAVTSWNNREGTAKWT